MRATTLSMVAVPVAVAVLVATAGTAKGGPPEVVIGIAAHLDAADPRVQVPGQPGVQFTNILLSTRPPTSGRWVFNTTTNTGIAATSNTVISGDGLIISRVIQSGVTEYAPGLAITGIGATVPRFDDNGQWAVGFGGTGQQVIVRTVAGVPELAISGSTPVTALSDASYSGNFSGINLTSAGVTFLAGLSTGTGVSEAGFVAGGLTAPVVVPTSVPAGQAASGAEVLADIDTGTFQTDSTGNNWLALGELTTNSSGPKVLVVNGAVVLQSGQPVAGIAGGTLASISSAQMNSNGSWFVRGTAVGGPDFVMRDGVVLATAGAGALGSPITLGSAERWGSFQDVKANHFGDYVILGRTQSADTLTRDVLVVNGLREIARLSQGIDTTNTGVASTNRFMAQFNSDRVVFANDYYVYFSSRMKDSSTGTTTLTSNGSLLRASWCNTDIAGPGQAAGPDGELTADDIIVFLNGFFAGSLRSNVSGPGQNTTALDTELTADDIIVFLNGFFAGC